MQIHQAIDDLGLPASANTAVAIGVFDGVHLGHQAVLATAVKMARSLGLRSVAFSFNVHPAVILAPDKAPPSICTVDQRVEFARDCVDGIDDFVIAPFTRAFASMSPDEFVRSILVDRLHAKHVVVGADFRYGHNRAGNDDTLIADGERYGFTVDIVPPLLVDGERVSSTRIRSLVASGEVVAAERLLGHDFAVAGTVVHGKKLGREIGFPTANLQLAEPRQLLPADGVYAGYTDLTDGRRVRSAISVGTNPTTDQDGARKVEAYLTDGFDEDLYGAQIRVAFRDRLRGQIEFTGLGPLTETIRDDVDRIERILARE